MINLDTKAIKEAIEGLCDEKGLAYDSVIETLNAALAAAYRKDFATKNHNIDFDFDLESGKIKVTDTKTVVEFDPKIEAEIRENGVEKKFVKIINEDAVAAIKAMAEAEGKDEKRDTRKKKDEEGEEEGKPVLTDEQLQELSEDDVVRYNPKTDILLEEAKELKKTAKVGAVIVSKLDPPEDFGRMAAQTAKQVIIQKVRESERESIFEEFKDKQDKLMIGIIQRQEAKYSLVDFGKMSAIMPLDQQIKMERYTPGTRMKFYVVSIEKGAKGPEMVVSRSHPNMLEKLFEMEIPEIATGAVTIQEVAREAGSRSKVAVQAEEENIDPIGSCVGQRGTRIQTIIAELGGEKIDIIPYDEDIEKFIANALLPAKILSIETDTEKEEATVIVAEDQLSLAIGKVGQNVRLAAKLTGWKINILKANEDGTVEKLKAKDEEDKDDEEKPIKAVKEVALEDAKEEKKEKKVKKTKKKEDSEEKEEKKEKKVKKIKKVKKEKEEKEEK